MVKRRCWPLLLIALLGLLCGCGISEAASFKTTDNSALSALVFEFSSIPQTKEQAALVDAYAELLQSSELTQKEIDGAVSALKSLKEEILTSPVSFVDGAVVAHVRTALGFKDSEVITVGDCLSLEVLDCSCTNGMEEAIKVTYDFRYFPNLRTLDLSGNAITDLSGLAYLTHLTTLSLSSNSPKILTNAEGSAAVKDLSYTILSAIPLESLDLSGSSLSSIELLPRLTELKSLNLSDSGAILLGDLRDRFPNLERLDLSNCSVADPERLSDCESLKVLDLSGSGLSDLSFVSECRSLSELSLNGLTDVDFSVLPTASQLSSLSLSGCGISDLSWAAGFERLLSLDLSNNKIENISTLFQNPSLSRLNLSGNRISEFALTDYLTSLTDLDLSQNGLTSFSINTSSGVCGLKQLNLSDNSLKEIDVSGCQDLISLNLSTNLLSEFSLYQIPLKSLNLTNTSLRSVSLELPDLTELFLSSNKTVEFSALLPALKNADFGKTEFSDLEFLRNMRQIERLSLSVSGIDDSTPMLALPSLRHLTLHSAEAFDLSVVSELFFLESLSLPALKTESPILTSLPNLTYLSISERGKTDFSGITDLTRLEVFECYALNCPEPKISGFPSLKSLSLRDCSVTGLSGVTNLPLLESLDLSANGFRSIEILGLPSLIYVNLSGNQMTSVAACAVEMTQGTLDFRNNPITGSESFPSPSVRVLR